MGKKSKRNADKEKAVRVLKEEIQLEKMRYYWIFNAVWLLLGAFLIVIGADTPQNLADNVASIPAVKVGIFIVIMAVGMGVYGLKRRISLLEQIALYKPKEKKHMQG